MSIGTGSLEGRPLSPVEYIESMYSFSGDLTVAYQKEDRERPSFCRYTIDLGDARFYTCSRVFPVIPFFAAYSFEAPLYVEDLPKDYQVRSMGQGSFTKARLGRCGSQIFVWKKTKAGSLLDRSIENIMSYFSSPQPGLALPLGYCTYTYTTKTGESGRNIVYIEKCYTGDLKDPDLFSSDALQDIYPLVSIFKDVFSGLAALHVNGLWHRDLKLHNIFYLKNGSKYEGFLGDWDMLKAVGDAGTPDFLAPEVVRNPSSRQEYFKGDMWAAGLTILKILTTIFRADDFAPAYQWKSFSKIWRSTIVKNKEAELKADYPDLDLMATLQGRNARIERGKAIIKVHIRKIQSLAQALDDKTVKDGYLDLLNLTAHLLNDDPHMRPDAHEAYSQMAEISLDLP